jgi:transposase
VCDEAQPHLITDVRTTEAGTPDVALTAPIQAALAERALLPNEQVVDSGYVDAALLVESRSMDGIELIGPVHANTSWQAQEDGCFEPAHFGLDWEHQQATCPPGKTSIQWIPVRDAGGRAVISMGFAQEECLACPVRARCTRAKIGPRKLMVRPQADHEALQAARQRETTEPFKQGYAKRAGVEGTMSQGVRRSGLRQARYVGRQKTHLQAVATAVALNVVRLVAWLDEIPCAKTRPSRFARLALAS